MNSSIVRVKTIIFKEVLRFLGVYNQTIIAPVVTSLLFFSVFTIVFGDKTGKIEDYKEFVASGLIIMSMLQNAFANTQSSVTVSKVLGFVTDYILPPIAKWELLLGISASGLVRGVLVGIVNFAVLSMFTDIGVRHLVLTILYSFFSCLIFSLLGLITGTISKNFDTAAAYNTYIVLPLTFLSGTFYSASSLPKAWQIIVYMNPVFYMIDGFRYGLLGVSDSVVSNHIVPLGILLFWSCILALVAYIFIKKKYSDVDL